MPVEVEEAILKCLSKVPDQRFQVMSELASVLTKAIEEKPPADIVSLVEATLSKVKDEFSLKSNDTAVPDLAVSWIGTGTQQVLPASPDTIAQVSGPHLFIVKGKKW